MISDLGWPKRGFKDHLQFISAANYCLSRLESLSINNCTASLALINHGVALLMPFKNSYFSKAQTRETGSHGLLAPPPTINWHLVQGDRISAGNEHFDEIVL